MRKFRELFMLLTKRDEPVGVDPLTFATLPAAVFGAYRLRFMPRDSIANLAAPVDRVLRKALSGGRTEGLVFYFQGLLRYFDFNSLYPTVMVKYPYPRGHPLYFGTRATWPADCTVLEGSAELADLDQYLRDGTIAILKVDVTCPKTLRYPVLGEHLSRSGEPAKFMFTLDDKRDYWTGSVSLRRAISKGYKVTAVHAVAWWPEDRVAPAAVSRDGKVNANSLWGSWFREFMPLKDAKSGYPKECKTDEQKEAYRRAYAEWWLNQYATLDAAEIETNPALKLVAKLLLNTLWGKVTQNPDQQQTSVFNGDQVSAFHDLVFSGDWVVRRVLPMTSRGEDGCRAMEVVHERPRGFVHDNRDCGRTATPHAVHIGVLVTEYARDELYQAMELAGEHAVKYYDTDGLIVEDSAVERLRPLIGPFLGQMKDELGGDRITEWACGAPKVYAYATQGGKTKGVAKGFRRAAMRVAFMQQFTKASCIAHGLGLRPPPPHVVRFNRIARDRVSHSVFTESTFRKFRFVQSKVHVFADGTSLPFGHAGIAFREFQIRQDKDKWLAELHETQTKLAAMEETVRDRADAKKEQDAEDERDDRVFESLAARVAEAAARLRRGERLEQLALDVRDDSIEDEQEAEHEWMSLCRDE